MKKFLLVAFFATVAGLATAGAQTQSFSVPTASRDQRMQQQRQPPIPPVRRGELGAFPRAAKGGNPVQMVNPGAPRKYYGAPQDTVTWDPSNPSRITGLILFGFAW